MREVPDKISLFVEKQFPGFYAEDGANFVEFVKEYYKHLESTNNAIYFARNLVEFRDIDKTIDDFVVHFKEKYLKNFPLDLAVPDTKFIVKHIMDFYRSKGSQQSYEIFFKAVYDVTPTLYYPKDDLFKLSDGTWFVPVYLELESGATNTVSLAKKQVIGTISQATAFVEKIIKTRVNGKYINVVLLSGVQGTFNAGEILTMASNPAIVGYPKILGSLSSCDVITGGAGFAVGDIVRFTTGSGRSGLLRVATVSTETGIVKFELEDGGFGYTNTSSVLVSTKVLDVANGNAFTLFERVFQPLANINFVSANANFQVGDVLQAWTYNISGNTLAGNGVVLSVSQSGANGTLLIATQTGNVSSGNTPALTQFFKAGNTVTALTNTYTNVTASGNVMGQNATSIGVISVNNTFTTLGNNYIYGNTSGTNTSVQEIGVGTGASFSIGSLTHTENVRLDTTFLRANNQANAGANVPFMDIIIDGSNANTTGGVAYGFPKFPLGDSTAVLLDCFNISDQVIGTVASIVGINGGQDYTKPPFVSIFEERTAGFDKRDFIFNVSNTTSNFGVGEIVQQSGTEAINVLTVNNFTGNTAVEVGEFIYQSNGSSNTATGIVYSASIATGAGTITVTSPTGTWNTSLVAQTVTTHTTSNVVSANTSATIAVTGKGIVKTANSSVITVKRLTFFDTFGAGNTISGTSSGATATLTAVIEDDASLNIGNNAIVTANVVVANGTVTAVDIYDSGVGYIEDEVLTVVDTTSGANAFTVKTHALTQGIGQGFYTTTRGFLDNDKFLHDGEYYQNFSYDVRTSIPLDKYSDVLKKVVHVAGTKLFGTFVNMIEENVQITSSNTQITIT
jgi:hypothetical protein